MKRALIIFFVCLQTISWADSIRLFNDSPFTLKAIITGADGTVVGEVVLNPRDASVWSDEYNEFGVDSNNPSSQAPYTVDWYCTGGNPYGTCQNVAEGATVLAQGCLGAQECDKEASP